MMWTEGMDIYSIFWDRSACLLVELNGILTLRERERGKMKEGGRGLCML